MTNTVDTNLSNPRTDINYSTMGIKELSEVMGNDPTKLNVKIWGSNEKLPANNEKTIVVSFSELVEPSLYTDEPSIPSPRDYEEPTPSPGEYDEPTPLPGEYDELSTPPPSLDPSHGDLDGDTIENSEEQKFFDQLNVTIISLDGKFNRTISGNNLEVSKQNGERKIEPTIPPLNSGTYLLNITATHKYNDKKTQEEKTKKYSGSQMFFVQ